MAPVVDELKDKYKEKVAINQIDTEKEENQALVKKYGINALPTFVFVDSKGKVIKTQEGALPKEMLEKWIKYLLANAEECPT